MRDTAREDLIADLYQCIAKVTTRFEFTSPVAPEDLEHVRNELSAAVPGYPVWVELDPDPRYVLVEVDFPAGIKLYRRQMIIG
jgi:hypothetical protein